LLLALLLVVGLGVGGLVLFTRGGGNRAAGPVGDTASAYGATTRDDTSEAARRTAEDSAATEDAAALPTGGGTTVFVSDSAAGDALYRGSGQCLSCHGTQGEGVPNLGPELRDARWLDGDGSRTAIEHVVAVGVSPPRVFPIAMPAYGEQLTPEQIRAVAAYVFSLSHPGAVVPDTLPTRSDSVALVPDTVRRPR
jgi:mono/diheme cytochrome c family protein